MNFLVQSALRHLPVGEVGNEFKIALTPKLGVLCERRVSPQGAKIAKVKGIPGNDSSKVVKVFIPRLTFAFFAPLREPKRSALYGFA